MASATPCDDLDDPASGDEPVFGRGKPRVERFDAAGRDRDPQAFKTAPASPVPMHRQAHATGLALHRDPPWH